MACKKLIPHTPEVMLSNILLNQNTFSHMILKILSNNTFEVESFHKLRYINYSHIYEYSYIYSFIYMLVTALQSNVSNIHTQTHTTF